MGLKCLLGHDFTEPEVEREREEDGDEVITTVTEVKTCARCGETQIVSENTEVTTMRDLTTEAAAGRAASEPGSTDDVSSGDVSSEQPASVASETETAVTEAEPERDEPAGSEPEATVGEDEAAPSAGSSAATDDTAVEGDDAVILDDEPGDDSIRADSVEDDSADGYSTEDDAVKDELGTNTAEGPRDDQPDTADDGAALLDNDSVGGEQSTDHRAEAGSSADEGDEASAAAETESEAEADDGVILDETAPESDDRDRGAWPNVAADDDSGTSATEPTPWPEQTGDDEGFSATVDEADDDTSVDDAGVEFGGLTPESTVPSETDEGVEYVESPDQTASKAAETGPETTTADQATTDTTGEDPGGVGITHGESPSIDGTPSQTATEYYCPECGMTRDSSGSSMRAGDICPECKRGYITERST